MKKIDRTFKILGDLYEFNKKIKAFRFVRKEKPGKSLRDERPVALEDGGR